MPQDDGELQARAAQILNAEVYRHFRLAISIRLGASLGHGAQGFSTEVEALRRLGQNHAAGRSAFDEVAAKNHASG
jgi:hypothetical protein